MSELPSGSPRPEPTRRLSGGARVAWSIGALAWALPLAIGVPSVLSSIDEVPGPLVVLGTVIAVMVGAVGALGVPQLRWRRWRWELRDEEVDLRHGAVTEIRTIVPMARVQHVDVRRTPIAQSFGMADVVIHTAAGQTTIPMLPEADAVEVRDRIADLARTPDEL